MQFSSKSFKATLPNTLAAKYRKALQKHPFALFGLPFLATIVAGSFLLTPATALRYERYDRKNQQISQEEAMGLGQNRRKVNMKDEYYVSGPLRSAREGVNSCKTRRTYCTFILTTMQRLQAKDLEDWEQRRVKRLPGEPDGTLV
jgi:cytochrome c oxidase assembly protein subunit 16